MPQTFYTEEEYKEVLNDLRAVQHRLDVVERQRPQWAMGYTSDSVAAQTAHGALHEIWKALNVTNQTDAQEKIRRLLRVSEYQKPAF